MNFGLKGNYRLNTFLRRFMVLLSKKTEFSKVSECQFYGLQKNVLIYMPFITDGTWETTLSPNISPPCSHIHVRSAALCSALRSRTTTININITRCEVRGILLSTKKSYNNHKYKHNKMWGGGIVLSTKKSYNNHKYKHNKMWGVGHCA